MAYLLGIDIGTSGTKTVLFDEKGNGLASYTGEYGMQQPKNGWAEQHPQDWWEAVVDGIRLHPLLKYYKIPKDAMEKITQRVLFD